MIETLAAFPILVLVAATTVQLALVAIAGLLVRYAAVQAARAAAVTAGSLAAARRVAQAACEPIDTEPEVGRVAPTPDTLPGVLHHGPPTPPHPGPTAPRVPTRGEAEPVSIRVTCRLRLAVPLAGPLLARALGAGPDGRLPLTAIGRHPLQSEQAQAVADPPRHLGSGGR